MMQYAILKVGAPNSKVKHSRLDFFSEIKFNVGGYLYSFYDWEHGILRGNRKGSSCDGMFPSSVPFARKDPRITFCVAKPDPRIHFTIFHGSNSCPSIRSYSSSSIDEELTIATKAFCEKESNFRFDEAKLTLNVSKIFKWYQSDFVDDAKLLPWWIYKFIDPSVQQRLDVAFENKIRGNNIKVVDIVFDWSLKFSWIYGVFPFEIENVTMNECRTQLSVFAPKSFIKSKSQEIRVEL
jgi:hypothetical protein